MSIAGYILRHIRADEVLNPEKGAGSYIHDFVHSKNSRFKGKSKQERIRMALGAWYGAANKAGIPTSGPDAPGRKTARG